MIGENHFLSLKEIERAWDGIDPEYTPEKAVDAVKAVLPQKIYEELFPNR